jgi:putative component of toxin-antitoxin plasmid stabilization module
LTEDRDYVVLQTGSRSRVLGIRRSDRTCPAEQFLAELEPRAQAEFKARLERLTEAGWLKSPNLMRRLEVPGAPPVYEVKAHSGPGWRLYVIKRGVDWVATHGRRKPSDRKVRQEAERAREIYGEGRAR